VKSPCRICHSLAETRDDPLVAPCQCDGSLRYVHNSCQQAWLRHRRGPLSYSCELCRSQLACRLTLATRLEMAAVSITSAVVWIVQIDSTARIAHLGVRLLAAHWGQGVVAGRLTTGVPSSAFIRGAARLLPLSTVPIAGCEALAQSAVLHLALAVGSVVVAHHTLACFRRPLVLLGEDVLSRFSIVKIGGCVLVLLHEMLWAFPSVQRVAPQSAWHVIGMALLLDTLLLAFFRIPREERGGRGVFLRVALAACRLTADFLPFAAVFFLWSASIVMIMAASLVPCIALLFREALQDVRRRRHRHGSVQMAVLVLRGAARLMLVGRLGAGAGGRAWVWGDQAVTMLWLFAEGALVWDLLFCRRGACCAREASSQILWTAAVLGQATLISVDYIYGLGPARYGTHGTNVHGIVRPGEGGGGSGAPLAGALLQLPQLFRGSELPAQMSPGSAFVAGPGTQEAAMLLCLATYVSIHAVVFANWAYRARYAAALALAHVEPDRVVFLDNCLHHRAP